MGKEKQKKHHKKELQSWMLADNDRQRRQASESLRWMYETARGTHCAYLERLGVSSCDATNHDSHIDKENLTRKYMYDFIVMVMNLDHDFGSAMTPYVRAISWLFEEES